MLYRKPDSKVLECVRFFYIYDKTNSEDKTNASTTSAVSTSGYSGVTFKFGAEDAKEKISYLTKLINKTKVKDLSVSKAVYEAADCNHDGEITQDDVNEIINAGLLTSKINQTK